MNFGKARIFLLPAAWRGLNTCRASLGDLQPLCHLCPAARAPFVPSSPEHTRVLEFPDHHFGKGFVLDPKQLWDGCRQQHLPELAAPAPAAQAAYQGACCGEGTGQETWVCSLPWEEAEPALREPATSLSMFHMYTHNRCTSLGLWPPKCTQLAPKAKSLMFYVVNPSSPPLQRQRLVLG